MTRPQFPAYPVLAATLLLVACNGSGDAPATEEGASAQGEILEGSISDGMIPVDQVRSQSPRAAAAPDESDGASTPAAAPAASEVADAEETPVEPAEESSEDDAG